MCGKTVPLKEVQTALHLGGRTSYFCPTCVPALSIAQTVQLLKAISDLPDEEVSEEAVAKN